MENRFGGIWTEVKLLCLASYLRSYSKVMMNQKFERIYIDPFSGPGNRIDDDEPDDLFGEPKNPNRVSPIVAIECGERFDRFLFNDVKPEFISSLSSSIKTSKLVEYSSKEANYFVQEVVQRFSWKHTRAVLFIDPFGLSVDWATLEKVSKTGSIDVVMLFPTSSLCRMLPNDDLPNVEWQERLNRFLGTEDWKQFYQKQEVQDLLGFQERTARSANAGHIIDFVKQKLDDLFFVTEKPVVLKNSRGSLLFHLFFMCANRSPRVREIVNRIANGAVASVEKELKGGRTK